MYCHNSYKLRQEDTTTTTGKTLVTSVGRESSSSPKATTVEAITTKLPTKNPGTLAQYSLSFYDKLLLFCRATNTPYSII